MAISSDQEPTNVRYEDVERRAYEFYEQRGRADGHDWDEWLAAERELQGTAAVSESPLDDR